MSRTELMQYLTSKSFKMMIEIDPRAVVFKTLRVQCTYIVHTLWRSNFYDIMTTISPKVIKYIYIIHKVLFDEV